MTKKRLILAGSGAVLAAGVTVKTARFLTEQTKHVLVTEYLHRSERVPAEFDGFRIANASDLQSQYFGEGQSNLLEQLRLAAPDMIVVTGDLVDRNHTDFMAALKAVTGMLKIAPVYYVNGNHEMVLPMSRMRPFYEELRQMGVKVLLDEAVIVIRGTEHINVVGLSEYTVFAARSLAKNEPATEQEIVAERVRELCGACDGQFLLLLSHEPQLVDAYKEGAPDVVMCGHAHGGQFRLPGGQGLYAPNQGVLPRYTSGLHPCGQGSMLVSRGLGNSTFPFRLNNKPEITVLTLLRK